MEQETPLSQDLTIIVSSCDLFFDAWAPFFSLFWKRWPRCRFPIVVITNHLSLDPGPARAMKLGEDKGWASNLITTLDRLETEFVVYMQEDHFLLRDVDSAGFDRALELAKSEQLDALTFRCRKPTKNSRLDVKEPVFFPPLESKEGVFCDPCIWRKSSLRRILQDGETAWDFLKSGRERASELRYKRGQYDLSRLDACPVYYMKRSGIREFLWHITALAMLRRERVPVWPMQRGILLQSMHLRRAVKQDRDNRWLRAKYTGFGILSGLTQWQRRRSMAHVKKRLAGMGEARIPVHAAVNRYLEGNASSSSARPSSSGSSPSR